jgi:surfeit locus 1 family protein
MSSTQLAVAPCFASKAVPEVRSMAKHRLAMTLAVGLLAVCFVGLGLWQLERRAQRLAANARILARLELPALRLDGSTLDPAETDLRRGIVRGTYDYDHEVVLRNQVHNGLPGVDLLTPLRIEGSDAAVLVNRGWIPFEMSQPDQREVFRAEGGPVEVRGIVRRAQTRPSRFAPADPTPIPEQTGLDGWFRVDIERIQEQIPYRLLPLFLEQEAGPQSGAQPRFPRPEPEIALSEGPHLFYAGQWFAFAALLVGGYVARTRSRGCQRE